MAKVRTNAHQPWHMGLAIGKMLYFIPGLVATHLDGAVDFQNKVPGDLAWSTGFVQAVDQDDKVRESLAGVFHGWSPEQIELFNKGVDKALTMVQWVVYPSKNVVFEAGDGDWTAWIRGQCEELGMAEARAGRRVLEDI
ncbi:hypothetical protein EK21DRAFT_102016 [Setomelanomma holmii]|uniref:Uncharacterized protein n=1 Tax=Setomelanomma holmii TaxID=210430 RepID=A0A9P4H4Q9_9PLEO|nr:hypothetical protein EK21DRAFT_102016 [Setomelanomma holmii]